MGYAINYLPSWAVLGRLIGGANVVTAQYLRRVVPGRVTLAAEYQAQLGAGSQVTGGLLLPCVFFFSPLLPINFIAKVLGFLNQARLMFPRC